MKKTSFFRTVKSSPEDKQPEQVRNDADSFRSQRGENERKKLQFHSGRFMENFQSFNGHGDSLVTVNFSSVDLPKGAKQNAFSMARLCEECPN